MMPGEHDRYSEKEKEHEPAAERKPYHKPGLVRHGTVAEVTRAGGIPQFDPNDGITAYAS
jgi:hypothetical protein